MEAPEIEAARAARKVLADELAVIESRLDNKTAGSVDIIRAVKLIMKLLGLARTL